MPSNYKIKDQIKILVGAHQGQKAQVVSVKQEKIRVEFEQLGQKKTLLVKEDEIDLDYSFFTNEISKGLDESK